MYSFRLESAAENTSASNASGGVQEASPADDLPSSSDLSSAPRHPLTLFEILARKICGTWSPEDVEFAITSLPSQVTDRVAQAGIASGCLRVVGGPDAEWILRVCHCEAVNKTPWQPGWSHSGFSQITVAIHFNLQRSEFIFEAMAGFDGLHLSEFGGPWASLSIGEMMKLLQKPNTFSGLLGSTLKREVSSFLASFNSFFLTSTEYMESPPSTSMLFERRPFCLTPVCDVADRTRSWYFTSRDVALEVLSKEIGWPAVAMKGRLFEEAHEDTCSLSRKRSCVRMCWTPPDDHTSGTELDDQNADTQSNLSLASTVCVESPAPSPREMDHQDDQTADTQPDVTSTICVDSPVQSPMRVQAPVQAFAMPPPDAQVPAETQTHGIAKKRDSRLAGDPRNAC